MDENREGRPHFVVNEDNATIVKNLVLQDREGRPPFVVTEDNATIMKNRVL